NHSRLAKAALKTAVLDECFLERMELAVLRQPLDRQHRTAAHFESERRARAHRTAVHRQRAGAANLHVAGALGAGQPQLLAHHVEQQFMRLDLDLLQPAVESEGNRDLLRIGTLGHRFSHEISPPAATKARSETRASKARRQYALCTPAIRADR